MPVRINHCDPESLRLLAEDRLPPAELTALEEHLENCAALPHWSLMLAWAAIDWTAAARRYLGAEATG